MTPQLPVDGRVVAADPFPPAGHALGLLRSLGVRPRDRVVTVLPNDLEAFAFGLAAMAAGVVQVSLPNSLSADEAAAIVRDADPELALIDTRTPRRVVDALSQDVDVRPWEADTLAGAATVEPDTWWPRTRPMAYTSGTTGHRKGVYVGVHERSWGVQVVEDEHVAFDRRHGDVHLVVSPLYHSGPFRFAATTALTAGRVAVLPRFDVGLWIEALRRVRPTSMFCVPTHLHRLLAHPEFRADDLQSLTLLAHAGAPCPVALKERVMQAAPPGVVWEFYGSTEGQFTVAPPETWLAHRGSVGSARVGRDLEIRGDHGELLSPGQVGTVWCEAPDHARWEYWRDPERTAQAWDGAAFTVGDLGSLSPGGVLTLHGRPGDLIITGGVNVYPAEVERCLLDHPAVAEAVVFGVDDDEWGERVTAAAVLWPGNDLAPEVLRQHAREHLAREKVPKQVLIVDDLPRTPTGKVRRTDLAAEVGV